MTPWLKNQLKIGKYGGTAGLSDPPGPNGRGFVEYPDASSRVALLRTSIDASFKALGFSSTSPIPNHAMAATTSSSKALINALKVLGAWGRVCMPPAESRSGRSAHGSVGSWLGVTLAEVFDVSADDGMYLTELMDIDGPLPERRTINLPRVLRSPLARDVRDAIRVPPEFLSRDLPGVSSPRGRAAAGRGGGMQKAEVRVVFKLIRQNLAACAVPPRPALRPAAVSAMGFMKAGQRCAHGASSATLIGPWPAESARYRPWRRAALPRGKYVSCGEVPWNLWPEGTTHTEKRKGKREKQKVDNGRCSSTVVVVSCRSAV